MKIKFEVNAGWYRGEPPTLIEVEIGTFYRDMESDLDILLVSISIIKFGISLWVNINKTPFRGHD